MKMIATVANMDAGLKRLLDIVSASFGLLVLSPLLFAIAVLIKRHDGGPVFYRATRIGLNGQPFRLYKFRSMRVDADKQGPGITVNGDDRVTPIGRVLRRTKLDELPQLINVLTGDMSLVGPRPEDARYVARYTDAQREVLSVRPGITGVASLAFRHEEHMLQGADWERVYLDEIMPAKLQLEREYLRQRSVLSDIGLITRTMTTLMPRKSLDVERYT